MSDLSFHVSWLNFVSSSTFFIKTIYYSAFLHIAPPLTHCHDTLAVSRTPSACCCSLSFSWFEKSYQTFILFKKKIISFDLNFFINIFTGGRKWNFERVLAVALIEVMWL